MSEWTGSDVDKVEARCIAIGSISRDTVLSQRVTTDLAGNTLELIEELRRLQKMETRLKSLMVFKQSEITEARETAKKQGSDWMGLNSYSMAANMQDRELQNLRMVLGDGS